MQSALIILAAITITAIPIIVLILWISKLRRQLLESIRNAQTVIPTLRQLEMQRDVAIAERDKFNEILFSIIDGIIALDFNKNVILLNNAAQEITGYNQEEIYDKPVDEMIHLFANQEEILAKTYCQGNFNKPALVVGKEGKQTMVNFMTTILEGAVAANVGCILILHDLSKEEALEQMKLDFVSMASHELKTPLTSIIGYLSVFLEEGKDKYPKENLELLSKAFISAKQLYTLIQNLMNVNKIERDQLSVAPEPIDYMSVLTKAVEDLKAQANQKNIVLNVTSPTESLPKVMADPIRLNEVITNLVANAINYTNPGGKVEITIEVSPNELTTVVADTGVGIPKEAIPHLFSKFFRVSNLAQKMSKGTGLGLYISKSIIEKLRGKIWVESKEGIGSKFYFTLPVVTLTGNLLNSDRFVSQAIQTGALNY